MSDLRVRFAPSPTGYLHIGGARTALFNYLLARHEGGKFVLRIEDTDRERSTQESTDAILNAMEWLGLNYDEGPFYQSQRHDLHMEKIAELVAAGKAYRCYCTQEELEEKRDKAMKAGLKPKYDGTCRSRTDQPEGEPYVIRFRSEDEGETTFVDKVKGPITFAHDELDDLIIQRSDGSPTYNFVVVVDDATMGINLVVRGDDHINNTPRQILLYQALGYDVPEFAHVPMILGSDKSRLSKRHGATSVMAYRDMGYLPEALVNYLARLGWSHGDQEIFSKDELVEKFSLDQAGRSASVFNPEKLNWLNAHYLKEGEPARIAGLFEEQLNRRGVDFSSGPQPARIVSTVIERAQTFDEMVDAALFYYNSDFIIADKDRETFLAPDKLGPLAELRQSFSATDDFTAAPLKEIFSGILAQHELGFGKLAQPLRLAMTGTRGGPDLFELIELLGKDEVLRRLDAVLP
ncbi:MAG: glutamate--tRNA ligase [Desulfuromonas sp.]|nr:MAG: glutamate--tRNA ligase [Desulfuromonas sp.]